MRTGLSIKPLSHLEVQQFQGHPEKLVKMHIGNRVPWWFCKFKINHLNNNKPWSALYECLTQKTAVRLPCERAFESSLSVLAD